jgi:hypothetical protein
MCMIKSTGYVCQASGIDAVPYVSAEEGAVDSTGNTSKRIGILVNRIC